MLLALVNRFSTIVQAEREAEEAKSQLALSQLQSALLQREREEMVVAAAQQVTGEQALRAQCQSLMQQEAAAATEAKKFHSELICEQMSHALSKSRCEQQEQI